MLTNWHLPGFTADDLEALNRRVAEFIDLGFEPPKARQMVLAFLRAD